jgi:hypothetical protein
MTRLLHISQAPPKVESLSRYNRLFSSVISVFSVANCFF